MTSCPFYPDYCKVKGDEIHGTKKCHTTMAPYFGSGVHLICPKCQVLDKGNYVLWYESHKDHLRPWLDIQKASVVRRLQQKEKRERFSQSQHVRDEPSTKKRRTAKAKVVQPPVKAAEEPKKRLSMSLKTVVVQPPVTAPAVQLPPVEVQKAASLTETQEAVNAMLSDMSTGLVDADSPTYMLNGQISDAASPKESMEKAADLVDPASPKESMEKTADAVNAAAPKESTENAADSVDAAAPKDLKEKTADESEDWDDSDTVVGDVSIQRLQDEMHLTPTQSPVKATCSRVERHDAAAKDKEAKEAEEAKKAEEAGENMFLSPPKRHKINPRHRQPVGWAAKKKQILKIMKAAAQPVEAKKPNLETRLLIERERLPRPESQNDMAAVLRILEQQSVMLQKMQEQQRMQNAVIERLESHVAELLAESKKPRKVVKTTILDYE